MSKVDRESYESLCGKKLDCFNNCASNEGIVNDIEVTQDKCSKIVKENNVMFASTWLLDRDLWVLSEENEISTEEELY
ncbi:MAG: hypothetical protein KAX49_00090 [Halanaerobiales bacterium]|nr:hypothetical protein [Halanaerobiales bacterium]